MDTPQNIPTPDRPLGYWLRTVDALIAAEFARALDSDDLDRRDWMLLSAVSGELPGPLASVGADRIAALLARKGKRLRRLEERGWVSPAGDGTWTLTDDGAAVKERLGTIVDGVRTRVAGAVSPEDFTTTVTSLAAIARELGWDENAPAFPRGGRFRRHGFGPGHGFGPHPGAGHRFGPGHGFGPRPGRDEADPDAMGAEGRGCRDHRGHDHHRRGAEHAYERGFDAGFARGRAAG
ncbi:hypothetical protein [Microbacterium telephonicum]|uniref:DNA-binding MarR family transcriptional regulator n=1 Tax=Microbacterium telephonicum TaxID=1714841 RepID=A0A498C267_9MICO|nr:hypothetical protein [Microbacterium telephonicum]RLK46561.1 hypothetical protein C7474_2744 [Microbacterium telephonicum]